MFRLAGTCPRWMQITLWLAAIYNVVWGSFAILMPQALFRWVGLDPLPLYPEFWQCIGMIVGVYGIGYAIAARDPVRHWPIVLVGLLGKVFGPIGFAQAVATGRLPLALGATILTNDLIWWVPFTIILWHAARVSVGRHEAQGASMSVSDSWSGVRSQTGETFQELTDAGPVLLVFLRHTGCTFCREALADLSRQRERIEREGITIALAHPGYETPRGLLERYHVADLHCFSDPLGHLASSFRLGQGRFRQLFGLRVLRRGIRAALDGHGIGRMDGNPFQMPGAFLIRNGKIVREYRHETAASRPDYVDLACGSQRSGTASASATS